MPSNLYETLVDLVRLPSTSGHESHVRDYVGRRLNQLDIKYEEDAAGNVIGLIDGDGEPLMLSAHMDRVPPGLGHNPVFRDGVLYGDGNTNLGADDAAGVALVLEILTQVAKHRLPHPPLVAIFTANAEDGHQGAKAVDSSKYRLSRGIVFDNGFEAGVVISRAAAYDAFDITISGRSGHAGKDSYDAIDPIEIFRNTDYPTGSFADDQTRIQLGTISAGIERNVIASDVHIEGEMRSFEPLDARQAYKVMIDDAFVEAAQRLGGAATVSFTSWYPDYSVALDDTLLNAYKSVLTKRGANLNLRPSFSGNDTAAFRPAIQAFTISTGVVNEHSLEECIPIIPLEQVLQDSVETLRITTV